MKILVVRNDKLGDFITALPTLYIIKRHLPQCHLAVLIAPLNESIALECDFIDEIIIDEMQKPKELARFLKPKKFDLSITLFSNTRVAMAQFLARIPKRIAPATKIAQIFYTKRIKQRRSEVKMAEFEYNMQLAQVLFPDIDLTYPQPLLNFSKERLESVYEAFKKETGVTKEVVAFHPGFGGSSDANWRVAEYIEIAREILPLKDIDIVFTFGPGDERFLQDFKRLRGDLDLKIYESKGSISDFAQLIASFKLFVSTSTGTYHIASCVGTKTMTFFADTLFASSKRWKSIGDINLQNNYMIPLEDDRRANLFERVKEDIKFLVKER